MSEELGKIEKPAVDTFRKGRKLYFIPLVYSNPESPAEYLEKFTKYWSQVESQISDLEIKLGPVNRIYHELIAVGGEEGTETINKLNDSAYQVVKSRLARGAQLEVTEEGNLLTEFMDWNRCLSIRLQNQGVFLKVYESYTVAGKKRNEYITHHIDATLQADEIGILLMREGHQLQFPADIEVFYVAPPALDEINRWLRDQETKPGGS